MLLPRYIQLIASTLSCMATATFFILSIYNFLKEVLEVNSFLNIPVAFVFGSMVAAVIQLSIVSSISLASERSRPITERRVAMVKTTMFWVVGLIFGYSMWFASISYQNYLSEKLAQNHQYVNSHLQSDLTGVIALSSIFGQLAIHSDTASKNEKTIGNTCANVDSRSGSGDISKNHKIDAANFRSQAQALTPIGLQLEEIFEAFESGDISPRVAATKANAALSSPAIIASTQLVKDRLNTTDCQDAFMTAQLRSIESYVIAPLETKHLTKPSLSKDTMEAPVALLLCFFTFDCKQLLSYQIHIWLPPLVVTLIIDLSILGSSWVLARQKPMIDWKEFYPKGKVDMLQLMLKFHVHGIYHTILVPGSPSNAIQEQICTLMHRLEAHGLANRNNNRKDLKGTKIAHLEHLKGCKHIIRFDVEPEFWCELNKGEPDDDIEILGEDENKIVGIFKNAFNGNKHF